MGEGCLLLNYFLPHMRIGLGAHLVAKEAVKCSLWLRQLFPTYSCVPWKGERVFVDGSLSPLQIR